MKYKLFILSKVRKGGQVNQMIKELYLNDIKTVKDILELQLLAYKVEADIIGFYEIPPLKDTINTLKNCGEIFYGYFIGDVIAGIISYKTENSILDIHRVAVHPSFFRMGIAKKLLFFIEEHNNGVSKIIVSTGKDNKPAVELYLKMGYKRIKDIEIENNFYLTSFYKNFTT